MKIEIIGVYKIQSLEPVHLIEMMVFNSEGILDIGKITQEILNEPRSNWQTPYMEHILNEDGTEIIADYLDFSKKDFWLVDAVRIAFFFHYLDLTKPLITPLGEVILPKETDLPKRLEILQYKPVD